LRIWMKSKVSTELGNTHEIADELKNLNKR
jgi:hypothetical protein